ncbi:MAG: HAD family hydrolase [Candidatus Caenarcaniphilales bacterium]|nr:HAD family hydrolase [Candidatus Caenarcaniphilales bacterium]
MSNSISLSSSKIKLCLATDLDGTFLGGSDLQRKALYNFIEENREEISLIFVTGRDIPFVKSLIDSNDVPRPDFIIGDVGTTIVSGHDFKAIAEVQDWVDSLWEGEDRARELMKAHPHLKEQDIYGGKRVSFFYDDHLKAVAAAKDVRDAGFDAIFSANLYFDILPRGVKKGPTLLKLLEVLNISSDKVLTAGDTLNDLSLFETKLKSVAVSNSEELLVNELKNFDNVFHASEEGTAGIQQAIKHFEFF